MAANKMLIRSCLLYEYKLGTKAAEAARKICTAFGDDAVSDRTAQKWFKKFSSGDFSLIDEARSGRPKIINNEDIKEVVEANSSTTCLELAERFNVSDETIRLHLHQLGKKWKLSKWVPHELSDDNKLSRITICSANSSRYQNEPFFLSVVNLRRKVDTVLQF
jgi:[histone H3]-lysine36 N-dimethyltransferase SETMAR